MIAFTIIIIIGLSIINFVSILYYKYTLKSFILKETKLYLELKNKNSSVALPSYLKISQSPLVKGNYEFINKFYDKYVFLDLSYEEKKVKDFALLLFLWETILVVSLMFIMYITLVKYIKKEYFFKSFLEILLLTLTHKLGNFLSVQKINIELIRLRCKEKSISRLEKAYMLMEKDFKFSLKVLRNLHNDNMEILNLREEILKVLTFFEDFLSEKEVKLSLKDIYIKINPNDLENILFPLIENAIYYSNKRIYIKLCQSKGNNACIFIKNDIKDKKELKGAGVGLKIVEFIIRKYNSLLEIKNNKNFLVVVCFKK